MRRTRIYEKAKRYRKILLLLFKQYYIRCFFCKKPFGPEDIPRRRRESTIVIHHINEIHHDDRPENQALAHEWCHKSHHQKKQLRENKIKKKAEK